MVTIEEKKMCRVLKLEIKETQEELPELLRKQKTGAGKERVQALYSLSQVSGGTI
jgi:putative transposase